MTTYNHESHRALRCPHCGGQHIRTRSGVVTGYQDPGGNIFEAWLRTRFSQGQWEYAGESNITPPVYVDLKIVDKDELEIVKLLTTSPLVAQIKDLSRSDQMHILDAVMTARLRWSGERRTKARMDAISAYFMRGGAYQAVTLIEGAPDLFDASGPLGAEFVADQMLKYLETKNTLTKKSPKSARTDDNVTYGPLDESA